jgi:GNAT superfamily N-acetyltransferase
VSTIQVRPFQRADREQLTTLVNAHIQAVMPGVSVSVNTVLSQLERDPGEFIVDPWVAERATLVAEQRGRVVAAAHLLRYGASEEVGEAYRDSAELNWLLYWPRATHWQDSEAAAGALMDACLERLAAWGTSHWHADGALPAPGVYGMPAQWPHLRELYERAGFVHDGHVEIVGYIEVDANLAEGGRLAHLGGWADIANLHVVEAYRRRGVGSWLVGQAADWLRLARVDRLLAYAWPEEQDLLGLLGRVGFRELTRTAKGWHHRSSLGSTSPEANATPGP